MKPYYQHAGITIYHGDCREILPELPKGWCSTCACELADEAILAIHLAAKHDIGPFCDLALTDPPYGLGMDEALWKGRNTQHGKAAAPKKDYGLTMWDVEIPDKQTFDAILAVTDHAVIFGGNYFTELLPPVPSWIIWDKKCHEALSNDFADCEMAWSSSGKPARVIRWTWSGMIQP